MTMIKNSILKKIFWFVLAAFLLAIATGNYLIYPLFTGLLVENTESHAVIMGRHISRSILPVNGLEDFGQDQENSLEIRHAVDEFNLHALKIISPGGRIVYSTNPEEIGDFNRNEYFRNIVAHGYVHSKTVEEETSSLDSRKAQKSIIETHIPIMRDGFFAGALEIHLNISDKISVLENTRNIINMLAMGLTGLLSACILTTLVRLDQALFEREETNKNLEKSNALLTRKIKLRKHIQHEKENLIRELRTSLMKVKLLSGFLPICSGCKKIRDDKGCWNHIETYIKEHSEAEFSHGMCPDCVKEYYPDFMQLSN